MEKINEKKPMLAIEDIEKMNISEFYRYYFPGATDQEIDFFIWECTPYPFDIRKTLDKIYLKYESCFRQLTPKQ